MTASPSQAQNPSSAMKQAAEKVEQVEKKTEKMIPSREEAEHMVEEWKDRLSDRWDQAKHYVQDFDSQAMGQQLSGSIRKHPWAALGLAFAVGTLIGTRLFKR